MSLSKSTYHSSKTIGIFLFSSEKTISKKACYDFLYEKDNHLGNVHVVISDRKLPVDDGVYDGNGNQTSSTPDGIFDYYEPDVVFAADYYDGVGMVMPGRLFVTQDHRYGAQGSEVDQEIDGSRDRITTYYRQGNLKTMRWDSPDNAKPNASESPYAMFGGNPILYNDVLGDTLKIVGSKYFVAITNYYIAKLRATDAGKVMLDVVENAKTVYTVQQAISLFTTAYNGNQSAQWDWRGKFAANTMYYDPMPFSSSLGGADMDGFLAFGHEFHHMFSDEMSLRNMGNYSGFIFGSEPKSWGGKVDAEKGAIGFGNYLRTVYGYDNWKRTSHGDMSFKEEWKNFGKTDFNPMNERITGFGFQEGQLLNTDSGLNSQKLKSMFTKSYTQWSPSKGNQTSKFNQDGNKVE